MTNNYCVVFDSRKNAEEFSPPEKSSIISINDSESYLAELKPGWNDVVRSCFIDTTYNEESLRFVGRNHKYIYQSAFDKEKSLQLLRDIQSISESQLILVHCHAGRSRSAAVALYIHQRYGHTIYPCIQALQSGRQASKDETKHANTTVLELLKNPCLFDDLIAEIDPKTPEIVDHTPIWKRLLAACYK